LAPHVKKYFADHILGRRLGADEAKHEPVQAHLVTGEQHLHREPVALGDAADKISSSEADRLSLNDRLVTFVAAKQHSVQLTSGLTTHKRCQPAPCTNAHSPRRRDSPRYAPQTANMPFNPLESNKIGRD
jgi:hypothetical protein